MWQSAIFLCILWDLFVLLSCLVFRSGLTKRRPGKVIALLQFQTNYISGNKYSSTCNSIFFFISCSIGLFSLTSIFLLGHTTTYRHAFFMTLLNFENTADTIMTSHANYVNLVLSMNWQAPVKRSVIGWLNIHKTRGSILLATEDMTNLTMLTCQSLRLEQNVFHLSLALFLRKPRFCLAPS